MSQHLAPCLGNHDEIRAKRASGLHMSLPQFIAKIQTVGRNPLPALSKISAPDESIGLHRGGELSKRFILDLADALASQTERLADLFQRFGRRVIEPEPHS
jgi:hypothetical protein